jgi:hypothetical protein
LYSYENTRTPVCLSRGSCVSFYIKVYWNCIFNDNNKVYINTVWHLSWSDDLIILLSLREPNFRYQFVYYIYEPRHDKTNVMRLRPAWIQTSLLQTLLQVEKLVANCMDPDQTARMCWLVWIHAGLLVLSRHGSYHMWKITLHILSFL